jgi:hypothetical protein
MAAAGSRPSMHAHPAATVGTGRRMRVRGGSRTSTPVVQTSVSAARHAAAADIARCPMWFRNCGPWRCRPDGRCWPRGGVQVAAEPDAAAASAVRRRSATVAACPCCLDGRCPPRTPAPGSPDVLARRSPAGMRHCWNAWPTWRASRSPSHARAKVIAGRSNAKASSSLSPPNRRPGGWPSCQQPMTARAAPAGRPRPWPRCQGARHAAPR